MGKASAELIEDRGAGAASLVYFRKPARELLPGEALTLAVIPQNPARRGPAEGRLVGLNDSTGPDQPHPQA